MFEWPDRWELIEQISFTDPGPQGWAVINMYYGFKCVMPTRQQAELLQADLERVLRQVNRCNAAGQLAVDES